MKNHSLFWGTLNIIIGNTVLGDDPVERNSGSGTLGCYLIPALSCCNILQPSSTPGFVMVTWRPNTWWLLWSRMGLLGPPQPWLWVMVVGSTTYAWRCPSWSFGLWGSQEAGYGYGWNASNFNPDHVFQGTSVSLWQGNVWRSFRPDIMDKWCFQTNPHNMQSHSDDIFQDLSIIGNGNAIPGCLIIYTYIYIY